METEPMRWNKMTEDEHPAIPFLKSLYTNCDQGSINFRFLPSGKNFFIPLPETDSIPNILEARAGENAHFGVATRKHGDGTKQGIVQIPALWLDLDLDFQEGTNGEEKEKPLRAIFDFLFEPTFIVLSGGGIHAYWRLKEPASGDDIPKVEDLLKRLAYSLGGDMAATDASRILRVPGTYNYKYFPERAIEVWRSNDNEYNLSDFEVLPKTEKKIIEPEPDRNVLQPKGWEKELLDGVNEGERNTSISRLAGRYLSKGLSRQEIVPILLDANARFNPPLSRAEIETTLDSITRTHLRTVPDRAEKERQKVHYQMTTLGDVFNYPEPAYLIDTILIEGTVSVLGAYTGTGKSILALSLMKSVLTGEPLWGRYPVQKTGPVLLIDEETPQGFLRERTTKTGFSPDLPFYFLHFQDVRLDRDDFFDALMEKIEEVRPALVVIDSLIRVHRLKEDDAIAMSQVVKQLRRIANSGTTLLVIHHHKKGEGPLAQKLRGSSDIPGGVDIEYALLPKEDYLIFTSVKTRTQPLTPIKLKLEAGGESIGLIYQGTQMDEEGEIITEVVNILRENGPEGVEKIFKALKDRGLKVGINRLREILNHANGKELLEERGPKGKKIYKVNPAS